VRESSYRFGATFGTRAVMAASLFSATDLDEQGSPVAGPMAKFISVRPGVNEATALHSLDQITAVLNRSSDPDAPVGGVVSALRPAEIANYRSVSATPALLATVLAAGAVGALGLTLVASVRQRRRQFALQKALGFTHGQIAASVAWQSSVAAVVGVVLGLPIGIALGRWIWTLFADGISAVSHPTVPVVSIAAVAPGAIVFANLVALPPGRVAARTAPRCSCGRSDTGPDALLPRRSRHADGRSCPAIGPGPTSGQPGTPQARLQTRRNSHVDTHVMTHPKLRTSRHLRRTKLIGAFAFTALAGVGSYTATLDVLVRMSEPAAVVGLAAPAVTGGHGQAHAVASPAPKPAP